MILTNVVMEPDSRIDFYAGSQQALELLVPFYLALSLEKRAGNFYASSQVIPTNNIPLVKIRNKLDGHDPLVVCNYRDLNAVFYSGEERPFIMIENEYNRDSRGLLKVVALLLCRDKRTYDLRRATNKEVQMYDSVVEAVNKIIRYIKGKEIKRVDSVGRHSVGMLYMSFGEKVTDAIRKSLASLRRIGYSYPVTIIGDTALSGYDFIEWDGQSPYDKNQRKNFKFRAGRIKPWLYELSPYDYTLYIDADTLFLRGIEEGFYYLKDHDVCVTDERLSLKDLYNKKLAGWEINIMERDVTIIETGNREMDKFVNSGVLFFKKNPATRTMFTLWHEEWLRFQEWDEQLALMRALHRSRIKVKHLSYEWNNPHPEDTSYIFHNYGRGDVRSNPV